MRTNDVEEIAQLGVAVAATTGFMGGVNDVTVPLLGVPLVTIGMAAAGSLLSFAYGSSISSRGQLFRMALANTAMGAAFTALLPAIFDWTWVTETLQPPLAFTLALSCRWLVPLAIDVAPAAVRGALSKFFGITFDGETKK